MSTKLFYLRYPLDFNDPSGDKVCQMIRAKNHRSAVVELVKRKTNGDLPLTLCIAIQNEFVENFVEFQCSTCESSFDVSVEFVRNIDE